MIRDLLDVSLIQTGAPLPLHFGRCDLERTTKEALEQLRALHGDWFVLQSPGPVEGTWSCDGLRRIIENLCGNAVKYGAHRRPITVSLEMSGTRVRLAVHNEGKPIELADRGTIFDPYQRLQSARDGSQKGWGLGLTLVKAIAEAHHGAVGLQSTASDGTTFWVELPTIPNQPPARG
jgi:signal transduction histidine kinase